MILESSCNRQERYETPLCFGPWRIGATFSDVRHPIAGLKTRSEVSAAAERCDEGQRTFKVGLPAARAIYIRKNSETFDG
jgi:hypothetical protein